MLSWNGNGDSSRCTKWLEFLTAIRTVSWTRFSVDLLQKGVSLETVSQLLGHTSIMTTQKHYAPSVKTRQDAPEAAFRATL